MIGSSKTWYGFQIFERVVSVTTLPNTKWAIFQVPLYKLGSSAVTNLTQTDSIAAGNLGIGHVRHINLD